MSRFRHIYTIRNSCIISERNMIRLLAIMDPKHELQGQWGKAIKMLC